MKEITGIIGTKIGMTQVFEDNGEAIGVTAIEAGPCLVTQIKTKTRDGYNAVQLGFGKAKRLNKPLSGHLKDLGQFKHLREFEVTDAASLKLGEAVEVGLFNPGDLVDVIGISKGKGFAGVVKRHHFAGGPKTHGQGDRHRAPGSIGGTTFPGRVLKGRKMAGHMGSERVTTRNLRVVAVNEATNLLVVKGAVPGAKGKLLLIHKAEGMEG